MNSTPCEGLTPSEPFAEKHLRIGATFEGVRAIDEPIDALIKSAAVVDEAAVYNIKLAVHEICTNIVEHAYRFEQGKQIDIWLNLVQQPAFQLTVTLRDSGRPFLDLPDAPGEPSSVLDDHGDGGYGLFLVDTLMDSVEYSRIDEYNVWRLEKDLMTL